MCAFDSLTSHLSNAFLINSIRYVVIKINGFEKNPLNHKNRFDYHHIFKVIIILPIYNQNMLPSTMEIFVITHPKNIIDISFDRPSRVLFSKSSFTKFGDIVTEIWIFEVDAFKCIENSWNMLFWLHFNYFIKFWLHFTWGKQSSMI